MGHCFSSQSDGSVSLRGGATAIVVSSAGELRRYSLPVTVAEVLESENAPQEAFFICDSDALSFDEHIPSLRSDQYLRPASIYFIMPASRMQYRLAATDMAALAVKASVAIDQVNKSYRRRNARISPAVLVQVDPRYNSIDIDYEVKMRSVVRVDAKVRPSAAQRGASKLSRYSSRRSKLAVRSFKVRLTTIYEGYSM